MAKKPKPSIYKPKPAPLFKPQKAPTVANNVYVNDVTGEIYTPTNITIEVSPDLEILQKGMIEFSQAMTQMGKMIGVQLAPAIKNLQQAISEIGIQIEKILPSSPSVQVPLHYGVGVADSIANHPDMQKEYVCPVKFCDSQLKTTLWNLIQHLNDIHKWKRERIANWLDTLPSQPIFYPSIENAEASEIGG